jgi:hypothetical protein
MSSPPGPTGPPTGYISSLAPGPHALTPPGAPPARGAEVLAALAWVLGSWLRPADADAGWQQQAGHEERLP